MSVCLRGGGVETLFGRMPFECAVSVCGASLSQVPRSNLHLHRRLGNGTWLGCPKLWSIASLCMNKVCSSFSPPPPNYAHSKWGKRCLQTDGFPGKVYLARQICMKLVTLNCLVLPHLPGRTTRCVQLVWNWKIMQTVTTFFCHLTQAKRALGFPCTSKGHMIHTCGN